MSISSGRGGVLVGFDGSVRAMQALDWALDEAELRGLPLTLCHVWHWPYEGADPDIEEAGRRSLRHAAEHVLEHGVECARERTAGVKVESALCEGSEADLLAELSAGAEVLVVGSRGLGRLARVPVGSVAAQVTLHGECPVIVVRGAGALPRVRGPRPVVAGVDGSEAADAALAFAAREAELRQLPLRVVHACGEPDSGTEPAPDHDWFEKAMATTRDRHPDLPLHAEVVPDPPREALRDACHGAQFLVVGASHLAFGSVGQWLVHNVVCPIAVVPGPARPGQ